MFGAPSTVPSGGPGGLLWLPRFHLVLPTGEFPVPLSVVYPRDNTKWRGDDFHTEQTYALSSQNAT